MNELSCFIGYDSKEDIAYRVCKYSLNKIIYETNGQLSFFGRDNIYFKTINMSKKQRFNNICIDYNLKKLVRNNYFGICTYCGIKFLVYSTP